MHHIRHCKQCCIILNCTVPRSPHHSSSVLNKLHLIIAFNSPPPTSSLAGTPVFTKATTSKQSLTVSFATDVIALPSASKRLVTGVAAPANDGDHFMSAIILAAVVSPPLDHRTTITNYPTAAKIPKLINPYINNGPVYHYGPVDIEKPATTTTTTRADETPPAGLRASPALLSLDDIPSSKVGLLNVIIDNVFTMDQFVRVSVYSSGVLLCRYWPLTSTAGPMLHQNL